jgi:glutamine amidotransferase
MNQSTPSISIVDFGTGNIRSVLRALEKAGGDGLIISSASEIEEAEKLILPGVGHFGHTINKLRSHAWIDALNEAALTRKIPILGICLGMQLMCSHSEEGDAEGLGWFDARVTRMRVTDNLRYKIPHTGWNELFFDQAHPLMKGIQPGDECYFVHAYHVAEAPAEQILCRTTHEVPFISGLQRGNLFGVQFHPEKSHSAGSQIIRNFIEF